MQTVSQVIEDLQRFNPEARVEPEVDVQGVSPATLCCVTDLNNAQLEAELDEANDRIEKLESDGEDARESLEQALTLMDEEDPDMDKIKTLITEAKDIL